MRAALLVLALMLAVPSCSRDADPVAPPPAGGRELVVTSVAAVPSSIRIGETARIEVTVSNPSDRVAMICFPSGCTFAWEARNAAGVLVAPIPYVCTAMGTCIELNPGETRTTAFEWAGNTYDPMTGELHDAEPGNYAVRGGLEGAGLDRPSAPVSLVLLPR